MDEVQVIRRWYTIVDRGEKIGYSTVVMLLRKRTRHTDQVRAKRVQEAKKCEYMQSTTVDRMTIHAAKTNK